MMFGSPGQNAFSDGTVLSKRHTIYHQRREKWRPRCRSGCADRAGAITSQPVRPAIAGGRAGRYVFDSGSRQLIQRKKYLDHHVTGRTSGCLWRGGVFVERCHWRRKTRPGTVDKNINAGACGDPLHGQCSRALMQMSWSSVKWHESKTGAKPCLRQLR